MPLDLRQLGKMLFWYSIAFSIGIFIVSSIMVMCGLPPLPLTKIAPLFSSFFQHLEQYLANGQAIPLSLRPYVFLAVFANVAVYFLISYPTLLTEIAILCHAPVPIIVAAGLLGVVLEYFKYMYILSVIFGQSYI